MPLPAFGNQSLQCVNASQFEVCYNYQGALERKKHWNRPWRLEASSGAAIHVTNNGDKVRSTTLTLSSSPGASFLVYKLDSQGQMQTNPMKFENGGQHRIVLVIRAKQRVTVVVRGFQTNPRVHIASTPFFLDGIGIGQIEFSRLRRNDYCSLIVYDNTGELGFHGTQTPDPVGFSAYSPSRYYQLKFDVGDIRINGNRLPRKLFDKLVGYGGLFLLDPKRRYGYRADSFGNTDVYRLRENKPLSAKLYAYINPSNLVLPQGNIKMEVIITCKK
ncbi:hypothetical protein [Vibrio coralliilyticus]|uniref:hypothetical protein n=1 Tax=Vibrio coralliilyticus TaxID=190893 RepID=UPI00155F8628|nr:hypothetical protein [Vibrio coralliilyticus]NRF12901.1 hypothetical protein [Vibrio coralliilyticus]